jgi:hypothetical protein
LFGICYFCLCFIFQRICDLVSSSEQSNSYSQPSDHFDFLCYHFSQNTLSVPHLMIKVFDSLLFYCPANNLLLLSFLLFFLYFDIKRNWISETLLTHLNYLLIITDYFQFARYWNLIQVSLKNLESLINLFLRSKVSHFKNSSLLLFKSIYSQYTLFVNQYLSVKGFYFINLGS